MDLATLIAACIAAIASFYAGWASNRSRARLQKAEQRFSMGQRLQPKRLELYESLMKVVRSSDRDLEFKAPSEFGGGREGTVASIENTFLRLASDSTNRLSEARSIVTRLRLVATPGVVAAADRCLTELEALNRQWMLVLLELMKQRDEQDLTGVMVGVQGAQVQLSETADGLEASIREEQGSDLVPSDE